MKLACLRLARASEIKEGLLFGWSFIFPSSAGKATSSSSWLSFQFSVFPQGWQQESEGSWTTPFVFLAAACSPARSSTHLDVLQGFPCRLPVFDSCRKGQVCWSTALEAGSNLRLFLFCLLLVQKLVWLLLSFFFYFRLGPIPATLEAHPSTHRWLRLLAHGNVCSILAFKKSPLPGVRRSGDNLQELVLSTM